MWNTGLCQLRNDTASTLFFIDQEDTNHSGVVQAGQIFEGNGVIFPWCINSYEVYSKAFRIYRGSDRTGPLILWMFQNYLDDTVYYIEGSTVLWAQKMTTGEGPSSYLRVRIRSDETPFGLAVPYCSFGREARNTDSEVEPKEVSSADLNWAHYSIS
jgi:hypothetical protein